MSRATRAERALPELFGHEHEVLGERGETLDDCVLGRLIDRRRVVATLADPEDGLALGARRQTREHLPDVADTQPTDVEPWRHGSTGWKSRPESGLG